MVCDCGSEPAPGVMARLPLRMTERSKRNIKRKWSSSLGNVLVQNWNMGMHYLNKKWLGGPPMQRSPGGQAGDREEGGTTGEHLCPHELQLGSECFLFFLLPSWLRQVLKTHAIMLPRDFIFNLFNLIYFIVLFYFTANTNLPWNILKLCPACVLSGACPAISCQGL